MAERVSIIVEDGLIVVNGVELRTDTTDLVNEQKHAVQWYGDHGEVEYIDHAKPNETITDFAPYQVYVDNAKPLGHAEPHERDKKWVEEMNAVLEAEGNKRLQAQIEKQKAEAQAQLPPQTGDAT